MLKPIDLKAGYHPSLIMVMGRVALTLDFELLEDAETFYDAMISQALDGGTLSLKIVGLAVVKRT